MQINSHQALDSQASTVAQSRQAQVTPPVEESRKDANPDAQEPRAVRSAVPAGDAQHLDEADLRQVQELKARDREVRAHEQAHLSAGGALARGGAQYSYEQGPDGRRYAVGGEVQLESARVLGDPEATADRAEQVRRAALAPATPSAQDRAVAARAAALAAQSRAEVAEARAEQKADAAAPPDAGGGEDARPERNVDAAGPPSPAQTEIRAYEQVAAIGNGPRTQIDQDHPLTA